MFKDFHPSLKAAEPAEDVLSQSPSVNREILSAKDGGKGSHFYSLEYDSADSPTDLYVVAMT